MIAARLMVVSLSIVCGTVCSAVCAGAVQGQSFRPQLALTAGVRLAPLDNAPRQLGYELRAMLAPIPASPLEFGAAVHYTSNSSVNVRITEGLVGYKVGIGGPYAAVRARAGKLAARYTGGCQPAVCNGGQTASTIALGGEIALGLQRSSVVGLEFTFGYRIAGNPLAGLERGGFSGTTMGLAYRLQF